MPREDRRIFFSNDEVYKAVFALCTQKQLKKPPIGIVMNITEEEKAEAAMIFLDIQNPHEQTGAKVEYSRDFIAAALMLFCRGCGIPLPKSAKKSVMVIEGQLVLRVQV